MLQRDFDIYASAPMRRLVDDQARAMQAGLQRCSGSHALQLGVVAGEPTLALPLLGCWTRLWVNGGHYEGDLRAATDEPLPFADDAFGLVLLRHALEVVPMSSALLSEAMRVLEPGGVLALTGVHPLSGWAPWFHWRAPSGSRSMQFPMQLRHALQQGGLDVELAQRVGRIWPNGLAASATSASNPFGGGYVLVARKRRRASTPLRIKPAPVGVPVNSGLSPGTRRSAAL